MREKIGKKEDPWLSAVSTIFFLATFTAHKMSDSEAFVICPIKRTRDGSMPEKNKRIKKSGLKHLKVPTITGMSVNSYVHLGIWPFFEIFSFFIHFY